MINNNNNNNNNKIGRRGSRVVGVSLRDGHRAHRGVIPATGAALHPGPLHPRQRRRGRRSRCQGDAVSGERKEGREREELRRAMWK